MLLPAPLHPERHRLPSGQARGPGRRVRARRDRRLRARRPQTGLLRAPGSRPAAGRRASWRPGRRAARTTARPSALARHSTPRRREGGVWLAGEDQHRQAGRHGPHQRHPERGRRLQHGSRQKADAQRRRLDHDHRSQHDHDLEAAPIMLFALALVPVFMWLIGRRPRLRSMWRAQFAPQRRQVMVVNARYIKDARTPESLCPPRDRLRGSDMPAPGCLAAAAVWAVRAGDHPGDSVSSSRPSPSARTTASARDLPPSLRYCTRVWVSTVFSEMCSRAPSSRRERPVATPRSTARPAGLASSTR